MKPFVLMAAALFLTAACDEVTDINHNRPFADPAPLPGPPAAPPGPVETFSSIADLPLEGDAWADGMAMISVMRIDPINGTVESYSPAENVYGRVDWVNTTPGDNRLEVVTYSAGDASVELDVLWKYYNRTVDGGNWREDWFGPEDGNPRDFGWGVEPRSVAWGFNGRFDVYFNPNDDSYVIYPLDDQARSNFNGKRREYHKFGSWAVNNDDGTTTFGNTVVGSETTAAELANARAALTGTAEYNGTSHGVAVRSGQRKWIHSLIRLTTDDFETVRIESYDVKSFDETDPLGSKGGVIETPSVAPENVDPTLAELEFSGDLTVLDDGSFFAGDIANDGGDFTGTAQGNFYGPNADEAGGTFSGGYDDTTYFGSFGSVRKPASD